MAGGERWMPVPSGGRYLGEAGSIPATCPRAKARKGPLTMKVTVEVTERTIVNVLNDSGPHISYWCREVKRPFGLVLHCNDGEKWFRLGIRRALETMAAKSPRHFGMLLAGDYDGDTCDLFVQYGCFGEAVYG